MKFVLKPLCIYLWQLNLHILKAFFVQNEGARINLMDTFNASVASTFIRMESIHLWGIENRGGNTKFGIDQLLITGLHVLCNDWLHCHRRHVRVVHVDSDGHRLARPQLHHHVLSLVHHWPIQVCSKSFFS